MSKATKRPEDPRPRQPEPRNLVARALEAILEEEKAERIHLYQSILKQPYIFIDVEGWPTVRLPFGEPAVRNWIAAFAHGRGLGVLRLHEVEQIRLVLAGRAMMTPIARIDDPELLQLLGSQPIVAVVFEYVHSQSSARLEHPTEEFWKKLRDFAEERKLIKLGGKRFPGGSNAFSHQLKYFAPVLAQLGIMVKIYRSDGSKTVLERSDGARTGPSVTPSDANTVQEAGLSPEDDRERRRAFLEARKTRTDSRPSQGD